MMREGGGIVLSVPSVAQAASSKHKQDLPLSSREKREANELDFITASPLSPGFSMSSPLTE
jgi:hypothetical protein